MSISQCFKPKSPQKRPRLGLFLLVTSHWQLATAFIAILLSSGCADETLNNPIADEEKRDFPPVPEGFPSDLTPVWLTLPGYQKGDMPEHELIYRVLIKLWNQGERGFINGAFRHNDGKVYPLYPDVVYVKWGYSVTYDEGGNPTPYRYIVTSMGTHARDFNTEDFVTGDWETKYPGTKFVAYEDAGYDPYTFLTDDD